MRTATKKTAKRFRLNQAMIRNAQKILGSRTETEAIEGIECDISSPKHSNPVHLIPFLRIFISHKESTSS